MVHAKFYYAKLGGSQFIIDRIAQNIDVRLNSPVTHLTRACRGGWHINNDTRTTFDWVVSTADIRLLDRLIPKVTEIPDFQEIKNLRTRGITNVFCECDHTEMSWLYIPEGKFSANRIIYTGSFSPSNNKTKRMTCVVEFLYGEDDNKINSDLAALPGNLRRVSINHVEDAYVIQETKTRHHVSTLKEWLIAQNFVLVGRFAEWEYYNIDKAIEAGMIASSNINV